MESTLHSLMARLFSWLLLLLAVAGVYWAGLSGGFVFDDPGNILDNERLFVTSLGFAQLSAATFSGDAGPLGRPISMLTFALNLYATGTDAYYFKLTNLVIHLLNTVLVGWVAHSLLTYVWRDEPVRLAKVPVGALLVAALWALHPINLTSVLYVVQRMTSLSALFGFIAVGLYAWLRISDGRSASLRVVVSSMVSVVLTLLASVFSKESGLLFVLLIFWLELVFFRFSISGRAILLGRWKLRDVFLLVGVTAAFYVVIWVLPGMIGPEAFRSRGFTLAERLMTEARVMFLYLELIFYPSLTKLSLYHDDFLVSHSLLDPISTLWAIGGLLLITLLALACFKKIPMLLFAWGWFVIAHLLESTVFSLELIHEHRNYFATIGFALLVPVMLFSMPARYRWGGSALVVVFLSLLVFVTTNRALIWSNLVDQAAFEAEIKPHSDRANYELGRVYLRLLEQTGEQKYAELARASFDKAMMGYRAGNGAYFALIHTAFYLKEAPDPVLVTRLRDRLGVLPFYNNNVGFLNALLECQLKGHCRLDDRVFVGLLAAAVENPTASAASRAQTYIMLGRYFVERLGDMPKGEEFFRDAMAAGDQLGGRIMLAQVYRLQGRLNEAETLLAQLIKMDRFAAYAGWVESELSEIKRQRNSD